MTDKVVTVKRGGSYLTVPAEAVERYLAKGYDVVDSQDNLIKASVPNDVNALKMAYEHHVAKIKELESQVDSLKAQIKELQSKKVEKSQIKEEKVVLEDVAVEKPKTAKRSKK
jgi:TolA-binding protein